MQAMIPVRGRVATVLADMPAGVPARLLRGLGQPAHPAAAGRPRGYPGRRDDARLADPGPATGPLPDRPPRVHATQKKKNAPVRRGLGPRAGRVHAFNSRRLDGNNRWGTPRALTPTPTAPSRISPPPNPAGTVATTSASQASDTTRPARHTRTDSASTRSAYAARLAANRTASGIESTPSRGPTASQTSQTGGTRPGTVTVAGSFLPSRARPRP